MKQDYYLASQEQIIRLLETMLKSHRVFAPVERRRNFSFEEVKSKQDLNKIEFEYDTTILPPKKVFYPSGELMFTQKNGKIKEPKPAKPVLIFGLHPADLYGTLQMDEIMTNPKPDYYYLRNKKGAILVGINQAKENPYDFSERWGILKNNIPEAFDIFIEKIDGNPRTQRAEQSPYDDTDNYLLLAYSQTGKKIAQKAKLKKADKKEVAAPLAKRSSLSPPKKTPYDQDTIKKAVLASQGGEIWEELEKICLGCGICTYVCPLCYCFDVEDKTDYSTNECSRCRKWDACTLPSFSEIAGGKNFRPELKHRYFNWYFHKFVRALEEQGQAQCVGCGRCSKFCPAGINVENVLDKIIAEYGQN